jgi:hypothetical protein
VKLRSHLAITVATLGALVWVSDAGAPHRLSTAVSNGTHRRLETDHGVVHVWAPAGYRPESAATVVYVHGYYTDVDGAWTDHQLAAQFALSAVNAVFIACEAPAGARGKVSWAALDELVGTALAGSGIAPPRGPLIAVGHSGAYRTLEAWLEDPLLDELVLVDAAYADIEPFEAWIRSAPRHRIIDVTEDTVRWSEEMARDLADLAPVLVDRVPDREREWPDGARTARLVTIRAQWSHMQLVTGGRVLPMVLRLLPVELLADAPWDAPLGDLP